MASLSVMELKASSCTQELTLDQCTSVLNSFTSRGRRGKLYPSRVQGPPGRLESSRMGLDNEETRKGAWSLPDTEETP